MQYSRWLTYLYSVLTIWAARVTRSRATISFFLFILASYAAQITLHVVILSGRLRSLHLLTSAIDAARVERGFTTFTEGVLELCYGIPALQSSVCHTVYNASAMHRRPNISPVLCAQGLMWPENHLKDGVSEEVVYLLLETWLLLLSVSALVCQSIPHLIAVLAAQTMKLGWTIYRYTSEVVAGKIFDEFITKGACRGFDIFGGELWKLDMFYMTLGLSIATLLVITLFVYMLVKLYSREILSIVGSCHVIQRLLKWWLCVQVSLQLTAFFIVASAVVWFYRRKFLLAEAHSPSPSILQDAGFYSTVTITPLWLALGLYSVYKENRPLFAVYVFLSICLLSISAVWVAIPFFRYEYMKWRFLSCVTTVADVLLIITCVLSIICRVNFGKGLIHVLVVEQKLSASGFPQDFFTRETPRSSSEPDVYVGHVPPTVSKCRHTSSGACSVMSAIIATWKTSSSAEAREKGTLQIGEEEFDDIVINITSDGKASFDASSVSSSDESREKDYCSHQCA